MPPLWLVFSEDDILYFDVSVSGDLLSSVLLGRPLSLSHFRQLSGKIANISFFCLFFMATERGKSQENRTLKHTRKSEDFLCIYVVQHLRCSRHRDLADNKPESCCRTIFKRPERDVPRVWEGERNRERVRVRVRERGALDPASAAAAVDAVLGDLCPLLLRLWHAHATAAAAVSADVPPPHPWGNHHFRPPSTIGFSSCFSRSAAVVVVVLVNTVILGLCLRIEIMRKLQRVPCGKWEQNVEI